MTAENLKEILLNVKPGDYNKIMEYQITQEDIKDFYNLYSEFVSLENDYQQKILGRKEIAKDLVKRLELLKQMNELILRGIITKIGHYENASRNIKDSYMDEEQYEKVFRILRQLASDESIQYEIKTIKYPTYDSSEKHGYRTVDEYTGEVTILAEKEALAKFSDEKNSYLMRKKIEEIYRYGSSVVLFGNDEYVTEELNLPNKQTLGFHHPIVFYLQDDELANAVMSFMSFIKENGVDINKIETNDLIETIKPKHQNNNKQKIKIR